MNLSRPFEKARSVNSNLAALPTWVSSEYDPPWGDTGLATGRVLKSISRDGFGLVSCAIDLFPFGLGADNDAFLLRVVGFRRIGQPLADGRVQFIRYPVANLTCTVSGALGLVGGQVLNTERFADTLAITLEGTYTADVTRRGTIVLYTNAADQPAHVVVPLVGVEGYELEFGRSVGSPTMNALVSFLDEEEGE